MWSDRGNPVRHVLRRRPDPLRLGARCEGAIPFSVKVPANAALGLRVITADLAADDEGEPRKWVEALLDVTE
jgi:hypothetical protein